MTDNIKWELASIVSDAFERVPFSAGATPKARIGDIFTEGRRIALLTSEHNHKTTNRFFAHSLKLAASRESRAFEYFLDIARPLIKEEFKVILVVKAGTAEGAKELVKLRGFTPNTVEPHDAQTFAVNVDATAAFNETVSALLAWISESPNEPPFPHGALLWAGYNGFYTKRSL
jgi:hypothetical protein